MIQVTPQMRILLATKAIDFRKGIDGIAGVCRKIIGADPMGGYLFVFCNRKKTSIKLLLYDGQGYWLCQKRLSQGKFRWWPTDGERISRSLAVHELQLLLWNGDPSSARLAPMWRPLQAVGD